MFITLSASFGCCVESSTSVEFGSCIQLICFAQLFSYFRVALFELSMVAFYFAVSLSPSIIQHSAYHATLPPSWFQFPIKVRADARSAAG